VTPFAINPSLLDTNISRPAPSHKQSNSLLTSSSLSQTSSIYLSQHLEKKSLTRLSRLTAQSRSRMLGTQNWNRRRYLRTMTHPRLAFCRERSRECIMRIEGWRGTTISWFILHIFSETQVRETPPSFPRTVLNSRRRHSVLLGAIGKYLQIQSRRFRQERWAWWDPYH